MIWKYKNLFAFCSRRLHAACWLAAAWVAGPVPACGQPAAGEWPDLPLLTITTVDGEFPTCDPISPPEGCVGSGITNAEYVEGRLVVTLRSDTLLDTGPYVKGESGMRIKIRGNSTGNNAGQKPYKIKLSKKADLLGRPGGGYEEKDWNLLIMYTYNPGLAWNESNFLNVVGFTVSRAAGMEWTPGYSFVNVVMNDRYMGFYYLTDAVERGDRRVDIQRTGYLVENDAYWWNEEVSFKTSHQHPAMGWTFKYPDADDVTEAAAAPIRHHLEQFEEALYSGNDIAQFIDFASWAKWILVHDVLASVDDAGTNMYVYKDNFAADEPFSSRLKMGPLWDFDSAFRDPLRAATDWSTLHTSFYFYFPQLFARPDFCAAYRSEWQGLRSHLQTDVEEAFSRLAEEQGEAVRRSMELHRTLYPGECKKSLETQVAELAALVGERVAVIDSLVAARLATGVAPVTQPSSSAPVGVVDAAGRSWPADCLTTLPRGFYIVLYADGSVVKFMKR